MRLESTVIFTVIALIIGFSVGYVVNNTSNDVGEVRVSSTATHTMSDTMHDMTATLDSLSGDAFDKAFIEEMIIHHEGAIEMAEQVLEKSEKDELRELANNIIEAQTSEIEVMQGWLDAWYPREQ